MAPSSITMVTYHYVRELPQTRYPRIKGLLASHFVAQLDYMARFYQFVTVQDCLESIYGGKQLPANGALLTFDDGYLDHYTTVFPLLAERGIQGAFFPPAEAVITRKVLGVNKIHFVLATVTDHDALVKQIFGYLDELRPVYGFDDNETLFARFAVDDRFDTKTVIFIKRLLQKGLIPEVRNQIVDRLFAEHVASDEQAFASELYVTPEQLRLMARSGMYIGNHGFNHVWLGEMALADQVTEIDKSLSFHEDLGVGGTRDWVMCYPYGSYDDSLLAVVKERGCKLGLSCRIGIANLTEDNAFTLERVDTNDLPKLASAPPSRWTELIMGPPTIAS